MELFLLNYGIEPTFYQSEYNQYWEDAMFGNPELDAFQPDIIYVHTTNRNIYTWPEIGEAKEAVDIKKDDVFKHFQGMWEAISTKYHCPIIQNNFELPYTRVIGNMDSYAPWGRVNFISNLNLLFYDYAAAHDGMYINDINYQSADFGLDKWYDPLDWYGKVLVCM